MFSVLAAEAPDEPIVIYRFPALEMCRYQELVEQAAKAGIRIMNLSMGSRSYEDWTCFEQAARSNSALLFIISAGNDGQDIDKEPIYPAALDLENLFVVAHQTHLAGQDLARTLQTSCRYTGSGRT